MWKGLSSCCLINKPNTEISVEVERLVNSLLVQCKQYYSGLGSGNNGRIDGK